MSYLKTAWEKGYSTLYSKPDRIRGVSLALDLLCPLLPHTQPSSLNTENGVYSINSGLTRWRQKPPTLPCQRNDQT